MYLSKDNFQVQRNKYLTTLIFTIMNLIVYFDGKMSTGSDRAHWVLSTNHSPEWGVSSQSEARDPVCWPRLGSAGDLSDRRLPRQPPWKFFLPSVARLALGCIRSPGCWVRRDELQLLSISIPLRLSRLLVATSSSPLPQQWSTQHRWSLKIFLNVDGQYWSVWQPNFLSIFEWHVFPNIHFLLYKMHFTTWKLEHGRILIKSISQFFL